MKVTFVSNYINHHQIPLSNALYEALAGAYAFVQTEPMEEERIRMGWDPNTDALPYVCCGYQQPEACRRLIMHSDIVIFGGTEDETWLQPRLEAGLPVIRYSERLYRTGLWRAVSPRGLLKKYHDHTRYRRGKVYLLCAGAYVPLDFHIIRAYPDKMFRWGYFPETRQYDVERLMAGKRSRQKGGDGRAEILWAARFISLKHPEAAVELARRLKEKKVPFHMTMIGGGERLEEIKTQIRKLQLEEDIALTGAMEPGRVREMMEQADIAIMTSDRMEGWGAVINEAMNSGCAVAAGHMMGAAPYLIRDGENGCCYRDGDVGELTDIVERLLSDAALRERLGRNACETITGTWNAEEAARRLLGLCARIVEGKEITFYEDGPLSRAPVMRERRKQKGRVW